MQKYYDIIDKRLKGEKVTCKPKEVYNKLGGFSDEEKREIFKKEIEKINQKEVKQFVTKQLLNFPDYFWFSYQKSDHTDNTVEELGALVSHTKEVFYTVDIILETYNPNATLEDILYTSALLHDGFIYGKRNEVKDVFEINNFHPLILREDIQKREDDLMLPSALYKGIMDCIENHLGKNAPTPKLDAKYGKPEYFLYLADYLADNGGV